MKQKIFFRVDGGNIPEIGTGHIVRCLLLAKKLAAKKDVDILFVMKNYKETVKKVKNEGFKVCIISPDKDELGFLLGCIKKFQPEIVIVDKLHNGIEYMKKIKETGIILITFDDLGKGNQYADIVVNAIFDAGDTCYKGLDYLVLPEKVVNKRKINKKCKSILLSFGGYDYLNLTLKVMKALTKLEKGIKIIVAIGGNYKGKRELNQFLHKGSRRKYTILHNTPDFTKLLAEADLAVISGGLTLFQAMSIGLPSIVLCQYKHQLETASKFERKEAIINLGMGNKVSNATIRKEINELLNDYGKRLSLSQNSRALIDGEGLGRVAELVRVYKKSSWDTDFFGVNIARFYPLRINESLVKYVFKKCEEDRIKCLYYLSNCHDTESVRIAEKYGFHFVDIKLTFHIDLRKTQPKEIVSKDIKIVDSRDKDIVPLAEIARDSYPLSRYYFDSHFPTNLCSKFYTTWIIKSCHGFVSKVFVAEMDNKTVGFITCDLFGLDLGRIFLVGVDKSVRGRGIGVILVNYALRWFESKGVIFVEVVTQGRNYSAQNLYQKCGFRTLKTELWYHRWFD